VATCTSQQLQDCKFTIVVFNVLVSGKYGDKTAFQEPCVLQTKFGIFWWMSLGTAAIPKIKKLNRAYQ
jgi:hypothetical protein